MNSVSIKLNKPHPAQKKVLDSNARFKVLMAGRRFGKSLICQNLSVLDALNKKNVAYITPTYQLAKVFFSELEKIIPAQIVNTNKSDLIFEFITGGTIRFFTGERLDSLRGMKFHRVIIDEASYISDLEEGWLNSIRPTLTDYQGEAMFISTPRGKNYFYSLYMNNSNEWESFKFSTYDNPHIAVEEINEAKKMLPEKVFQQEYMANPQENADNPFGYDAIDRNIKPLSNKMPVCYGIDLAKSNDYSVIIGLDRDGVVCHFERFQIDWDSTKKKIIALPKVPLLIDSTGVGDAIVEDIQKYRHDAKGFKFTMSSKQDLIKALVSAIHGNKVQYPEGVIVEELKIFEYQFSPSGVKYTAPNGFHDDAVIALALAWYNFDFKRPTGTYSFSR